MDEDDLNFDFEKTLEEQQKQAANGPSTSQIPASAAIPVNQSEGSFKRNFRQVNSVPDPHVALLFAARRASACLFGVFLLLNPCLLHTLWNTVVDQLHSLC